MKRIVRDSLLSPTAYVRLRRLNLVRAALLRSDQAIATVGSVARHHGFSELGRFALAYRAAFGESPSTTLQGQRGLVMVEAAPGRGGPKATALI